MPFSINVFMGRILPFIAFLFLYSCKVECSKPHIDELRIRNYDYTLDSAAHIYRYVAGTGLAGLASDTIVLQLSGKFVDYYFSPDYDYKVLILPRNKLHILKDISYGDEKVTKSPGNNPGACSASASYAIDDSIKKEPYLNYDGSGRDIVVDINN